MTLYSNNKDINAQGKSFSLYLKTFINVDILWNIIDKVVVFSDVYIFSGIIRNFLTGDVGIVRDLDIVISKRLPSHLFSVSDMRQFNIRRNQFGGLKLTKGKLNIDIWYIEDTWGIKVLGLRPTPYSLIKTVFFNFSSIVYDYKRRRFIYDQQFENFLKTKKMNIVFSQNPNIPLCVVNIKYYSDTYKFDLSANMKKWLAANYKRGTDYTTVQVAHFGEVLYANDEIEQYVIQQSNDRNI